MVALSLGFMVGGCSFSYQLDSLFAKGKDEGKLEQTGPHSVSSSDSPVLPLALRSNKVVAWSLVGWQIALDRRAVLTQVREEDY